MSISNDQCMVCIKKLITLGLEIPAEDRDRIRRKCRKFKTRESMAAALILDALHLMARPPSISS